MKTRMLAKMNGDLSRLVNSQQLGILGNLDNRRVVQFLAAAKHAGAPRPVCISWDDLAANSKALNALGTQIAGLRIDSCGENDALGKRLIALGGGPSDATLGFGEIRYLREYHEGFCHLLDHVSRAALPCMNHPDEIRIMFDKWESHLRFAHAGLPRPKSQRAPATLDTLREWMRSQNNGRVFLKPLHGSSASGVCAFRWSGDREQLIAPIALERNQGHIALINSLRIHTYTSSGDIDAILGNLLPQGMIQEQWIPKATFEGGMVDLRVLVIDGCARHWVARHSQHPMTNLHLGNRRADPDAVRGALGDEVIDAGHRLAEAAAACFPRSLYAGVDILIDHRGRSFIGEINAFGDLLPRLIDRGETAYEAILHAWLRRQSEPACGLTPALCA